MSQDEWRSLGLDGGEVCLFAGVDGFFVFFEDDGFEAAPAFEDHAFAVAFDLGPEDFVEAAEGAGEVVAGGEEEDGEFEGFAVADGGEVTEDLLAGGALFDPGDGGLFEEGLGGIEGELEGVFVVDFEGEFLVAVEDVAEGEGAGVEVVGHPEVEEAAEGDGGDAESEGDGDIHFGGSFDEELGDADDVTFEAADFLGDFLAHVPLGGPVIGESAGVSLREEREEAFREFEAMGVVHTDT